jgi:hypothetical protein
VPNYKESTVSGESWIRSPRVVIDNIYRVAPLIHFFKEKIIIDGDDAITKDLGSIYETMTDPTQEFPLLNPETGEEIGTANYMQTYTMMHSLFMFLVKRDDDRIEAARLAALLPPPEQNP